MGAMGAMGATVVSPAGNGRRAVQLGEGDQQGDEGAEQRWNPACVPAGAACAMARADYAAGLIPAQPP